MKRRTRVVVDQRWLTPEECARYLLKGTRWILLSLDCGHMVVRRESRSALKCRQCA